MTVTFYKIKKKLHLTYKVCRQGFLAVATTHMLQTHTKNINDTVSKCYLKKKRKDKRRELLQHFEGSILHSFPSL